MPSRPARRPDDKRIAANRTRKTPKSRWQQLMDGDITIDDLDDEEIFRGRVKDKNGQFRSRTPNKLPRELLDAMHNRMMEQVQEEFAEGAGLAMRTLKDVMNSPRTAAPARVRAAEVWLERFMGKVPDKVQQTIQLKPFEEDIAGLLVDVDTAKGDVVLGQVLDERLDDEDTK